MAMRPVTFAVGGMAALFIGIVLTLQMAHVTLLLAMLAACIIAMLLPALLLARRSATPRANARSGSGPRTTPRTSTPLSKSRGAPRHG